MKRGLRDKDILALFKRLRSSIESSDRQAVSRALTGIKNRLAILADAQQDQRDQVASTALGAGAVEALEACIRAEPQDLADVKAACHIVDMLLTSNIANHSISKDRPSLVHAIIDLLDNGDPGAAGAAMQALCRLPGTIAGGRLAAEAGLIPKLVAQLGTCISTCNTYVAAFTIRNFATNSGNRATAAVKAGALPALARVVFSEDFGPSTKAQAAETLTELLEYLPADKMPQGSVLQKCAAVLVWRLRAGGEDAAQAAHAIRLTINRGTTDGTNALMDALAKAGAAAPLLQLARASASSCSSSSMAMQLQSTECIHILAIMLLDPPEPRPELHQLVVRAGGVQLAMQLVLRQQAGQQQAGQQQAGQQQAGQEQQALPLELRALTCLELLSALVHEQPQLAAQVADAGALAAIIQALHSGNLAVCDRNIVRLVNAAVAFSSDGPQHLMDALQAGAAQVIARVVAQQRHDALLVKQAVMLAEMMCSVATCDGAAAIEEADAEDLLPMVQPLVELVGRQGVSEDVQGSAALVLATLGVGSELLWSEVGAAQQQQQEQQLLRQQQGGVGGAGSSTAAEGGDGDGLDVAPGTLGCDQEQLPRACGACGADSKPNGKALMQCSACLGAWYCSATCQRKHWKVHKKRCPGYKGR